MYDDVTHLIAPFGNGPLELLNTPCPLIMIVIALGQFILCSREKALKTIRALTLLDVLS
jgi:hypothetical protein